MFANLLIFILLLEPFRVLAQQCFPTISGNSSGAIPQFQAKTVRLEPTGPKQRENQYDVTLSSISANTPYEVIVGVNFIQNYFDPTALDFAARANPQASSFTIYFTINVQANWTAVHVNYIATGRNDFRVGNFIPNTPDLLFSSKDNSQRTVNITYYFGARKWAANTRFIKVLSYISGIKYQQRFIDLQLGLTSASIDASTINIFVNITNQKYSIEALYMGYVMYAQTDTDLAVKVPNQLQDYILQSLRQQIQNFFAAIIHLNAKRIALIGQRRLLASLVLNKTPFAEDQIGKFLGGFQQQGIIVEYLTGPIITIGEGIGNISKCVTFQGCKSLGGTIINDGRLKCVLCRPNSQYNPNSGICECKKDFFLDKNNVCTGLQTLCKKNEIYLQGNCYTLTSQINLITCSSNQKYNEVTKKCQCDPGFFSYISTAGAIKCAFPCLPNFTFNITQEKCVCQPSFIDSKGNCIRCSNSFSKWNAQKKVCECLTGSSLYLNQCQACSTSATYDNLLKRCICNQGFTGNGFICRKSQFASQAAPEYTILFGSGIPIKGA